jgi:hypothetical protein
MELKDNDGATVMHYATQDNPIDVIPKEFLTDELLTLEDGNYETPLDNLLEVYDYVTDKKDYKELFSKLSTKTLQSYQKKRFHKDYKEVKELFTNELTKRFVVRAKNLKEEDIEL